jgi:hypothetical protein
MKAQYKTLLVSSGTLEQRNVRPVILQVLNSLEGVIGHNNLFAKDLMNFYRRYGSLPPSLEILKAFIIDKIKSDPEAYLFSDDDYKPSSQGILVKQVAPLGFVYQFINSQFYEKKAVCTFVDMPSNGHRNTDVKIFCPTGLITPNPQKMVKRLREFL